MSINPVSFGRTIKVNSSFPVANHAVELINNPHLHKGEARVQQQLQNIFFDAKEERAQLVSFDKKGNEFYIVSGQESKDINSLKKDRDRHVACAKEKYGYGRMFRLVKDSEDDRYLDLLKLAIAENQEPLELDINYSQRKHRIKSIDIRI